MNRASPSGCRKGFTLAQPWLRDIYSDWIPSGEWQTRSTRNQSECSVEDREFLSGGGVGWARDPVLIFVVETSTDLLTLFPFDAHRIRRRQP